MLYGLSIHTAPTAEPISLAEARKQVELPLDYTAHDEHLLRLITASRRRAEAVTGRQIVTATWNLILDQFDYESQEIRIPKPPLQSVTSISYVDTNGQTQTWSSTQYTVTTSREPGIVRPAYGYSIPTARAQPDAVTVRFVAGYGPPSSVPEDLKAAMLLLIGHWFAVREEVNVGNIVSPMPFAANALLQQFLAGDEFHEYSECWE